MPYQGSYVWKIRQKIGHDPLLIPSVDVATVREDGRLLLIYNIDWKNWFFPGGYVEEGQTFEQAAARELLEEGGVRVSPSDLVPFAHASGFKMKYPNGDVTWPFSQLFVTRKWQDTASEIDASEVSERRWFSIDELKTMDLSPNMQRMLFHYEAFVDAGTYQVINLKNGGATKLNHVA